MRDNSFELPCHSKEPASGSNTTDLPPVPESSAADNFVLPKLALLSPELSSPVLEPASRAPESRSPVIVLNDDYERRRVEYDGFRFDGDSSSFESDDNDELPTIASEAIQIISDGGLSAWTMHQFAPSGIDNTAIGPTPSTEDNPLLAHSTFMEMLAGLGQDLDFAATKDFSNDLLAETDMAIRRAFTESASSGRKFLPLHSLAILINESTVGRLLELTFPNATAEVLSIYTARICGPELSGTGRRKIFAIVVLMNRIQSITDFIDWDILDCHLPLEAQWSRITRRFEFIRSKDNAISEAKISFQDWSRNDEVVFSTYQACMLTPFFQIGQDKVSLYKLPLGFTLPFIEYKNVINGGYSRVRKVKIHPAHHNLSSPGESNPYFALKSLHTSDYREFCEEVKVLHRFSGRDKSHSHLTRLLLAYQQNGTFHLLFDWADGNLREFWEQQSNPTMNVRNAHWIMQQCLGLTEGLRRIHHTADDTWEKSSRRDFEHEKSWGRHGDLKPENILWFNDAGEGRLVISDFGLSRYHSYRSKSVDIQYEGFSPTYRPPECDLQEPITQRYDIWTLGCLFLEFLTWYILGFNAVNNVFPTDRIMDDVQTTSVREDKFFNVVRGDNGDRHAELKNSVKKWIHRLHANENCPGFVHSFLDMIKDRLLVPSSSDRWDSVRIHARLQQLNRLCRESEAFCVQGIPRWPSGTEDQGALMKALDKELDLYFSKLCPSSTVLPKLQGKLVQDHDSIFDLEPGQGSSDSGYHSNGIASRDELRNWPSENSVCSSTGPAPRRRWPSLPKAEAPAQTPQPQFTGSTKMYLQNQSRPHGTGVDDRIQENSTAISEGRRSRALKSLKKFLWPFHWAPHANHGPGLAKNSINDQQQLTSPQLAHDTSSQPFAYADNMSVSSDDSDVTEVQPSWLSDDYQEYKILPLSKRTSYLQIKLVLIRVLGQRFVISQQCTPIVCVTPATPSTSEPAVPQTFVLQEGSASSLKKRSSEAREDDGGRVDESSGSPALARKRMRRTQGVLTFACPFLKKSPRSYGACGTHVLSRIRDIKQHLKRYHRMPTSYCGRCGEIFATVVVRDEHLREVERCPIKEFVVEGMSEEQSGLLSRRADASQTVEEQWYAIFDLLFPEHQPRPDSPYLDESLRQALASAEQLMIRLGPAAIQTAITRLAPEEMSMLNEERNFATLLNQIWRGVTQEVFDIVMNRSASSTTTSTDSAISRNLYTPSSTVSRHEYEAFRQSITQVVQGAGAGQILPQGGFQGVAGPEDDGLLADVVLSPFMDNMAPVNEEEILRAIEAMDAAGINFDTEERLPAHKGSEN